MNTVSPSVVYLGPRLKLDLEHQRLWRNGLPVTLRPKAWQALAYLVRRPGDLVGIDTMLDALWPDQAVSAKTLANLMSELRNALGGDQGPAQLLETVHRSGYRLLPQVRAGTAPAADAASLPIARAADGSTMTPDPGTPPLAADGLVGRRAERLRLEQRLAQARDGQRQVVLVTGDPGMGKTALLDSFIVQVGRTPTVACRGACLEQRSEREPFGPVLALLADLCRGPLASETSAALRRCAPTWLAQMPWLVQADELPGLRHSLVGMGIGRMLREFGALLQALSSHTRLVLVLEDLHWADAATVELLLQLATDRAPARLMLVASWQPALAALNSHPVAELSHRLAPQGLADVLALKPLDDGDVAQWIAARFGDEALAAPLLPWLRQQAMGIPLYLAAAMDHLQDSGALARQAGRWQLQALPGADVLAEPLRALITAAFARLDDGTRHLLEAASVVGMQVSVQLLAAALQQDDLTVERQCNALAQHGQFLRALAPEHWPDGSSGGRYAFGHDIYRRALYDSLALAQRQALHRRVALRLEAGYAGQVTQVAGQLAGAYAGAAMPDATARVLEMTAHLSIQRFAYRDTLGALQACLQQLAQMPDSSQRRASEVRVQLMLGNIALHQQGLAGALVMPAFERAGALAQQDGLVREQVRAQLGATVTLVGRFMPEPARLLAHRTVALAESAQPTLVAAAHHYAGMAEAIAGNLVAAQQHHERCLSLEPDPLVPLYLHLHSGARLHLGRALYFRGQNDEALAQTEAAVLSARAHSTPADLVVKLLWAGDTCRLLEHRARAECLLHEALDMAETHDQPAPRAMARTSLAYLAPPAQRDAALIERLAVDWCHPGNHHATLLTGMALAETHLAQGRPGAAQVAWARSRAVVPPGALHDAELHCLSAEILLAAGSPAAQAVALLGEGAAIALRQGAQAHAQRCTDALRRLAL